jgi:hypothetical protein
MAPHLPIPLFAACVGAAACFVLVFGRALRKTNESIAWSLMFSLIAIPLAWHLARTGGGGWAVVLAFLGFVSLLMVLFIVVANLSSERVARRWETAIVAFCLVSGLLAWRAERSTKVVGTPPPATVAGDAFRELRDARQVWSPPHGVREANEGPMRCWIAVRPTIEIDPAYEQEQGDRAARQIPLIVVFLNDSFDDVPMVGGPLWHAQVKSAGGEPVGDWRVNVDDGDDGFGPAERRDFAILWNGRDMKDALVPAGRYTFSVESASFTAPIHADLPFEVTDAGPERPPDLQRCLDTTTRCFSTFPLDQFGPAAIPTPFVPTSNPF